MGHKHKWQIAEFSGTVYSPPLATFVCECGALKEVATHLVKSDRSKYKELRAGSSYSMKKG